MTHHGHTKEFIVGAVVGSLLGSVAALLTAPSAGKELRDDLHDVYDNLSDTTEKLAKRGRSIAKDIGCHTCAWTDKAKSVMDGATKTMKGWISEEEEEHVPRDLLIGGIVGGVIGAALGFLLAPKTGGDLREQVRDICDDMSERTQDFADQVSRKGRAFAKKSSSQANQWLSLAQDFVNHISEDAQEKGENVIDSVKDLMNNPRVSQMLDWAQLGYKTWQGLQSRKRR